jgi:predicted phage terminase large subunit-like protein
VRTTEVELGSGLALRVNPFLHRFPWPKQAAAIGLCNRGVDVLYGGAAGGGKTDCLLMAAVQYVDDPQYKAVVVRRTYPQMVGADGVITRSLQWGWRALGAEYNQNDKRWTFPSGAVLLFRHLDGLRDQDNFQGQEFQFIGLDELTQWSEEALALYPATRLRRTEAQAARGVPLRTLATSNPGGAGHAWVKRRYISPGREGCRFVSARMEDNPALEADEYRERLRGQGDLLYRRLALGDWDAEQGTMFSPGWFRIVKAAPPTGVRWVHSVDLATSAKTRADQTGSGFVGLAQDGTLYLDDIQAWRAEWPESRARIKGRALARPVPLLIEAIGGFQVAAQDLQSDPALVGVEVRSVKHKADKVSMAAPWAARAEAGRVCVVDGPWVSAFLDQVASFPEGAHDDLVDLVSQAVAHLAVPQGGVAVGAPRQTTSAYHGGAHRRAGY